MNENNLFKFNKILSIILLVIEAVTVTVPVIILGSQFNFPDILREPAAKAFELFRLNQTSIVLGYYIFLMSAIIYIPLSYSLKVSLFKPNLNQLFGLLTGFGITTAIFQSIGFIRWIFVVPYLSNLYYTQPESQSIAIILYDFINKYAGMSIGEHLGFIAMGSWVLVLASILICHGGAKRILGYIGLIIGIMLNVSIAEHFGGSNASFFGTINFAANTMFTFWIIAIAITIGMSKKSDNIIPLSFNK